MWHVSSPIFQHFLITLQKALILFQQNVLKHLSDEYNILPTEHSTPSCAKVRNEWSYTSTHPPAPTCPHGDERTALPCHWVCVSLQVTLSDPFVLNTTFIAFHRLIDNMANKFYFIFRPYLLRKKERKECPTWRPHPAENQLGDSYTWLRGMFEFFTHTVHIYWPVWVKLNVEDIQVISLSSFEFRESWCSERHTLLLGINEFVSVLPSVFVLFAWNLL